MALRVGDPLPSHARKRACSSSGIPSGVQPAAASSPDLCVDRARKEGPQAFLPSGHCPRCRSAPQLSPRRSPPPMPDSLHGPLPGPACSLGIVSSDPWLRVPGSLCGGSQERAVTGAPAPLRAVAVSRVPAAAVHERDSGLLEPGMADGRLSVARAGRP